MCVFHLKTVEFNDFKTVVFFPHTEQCSKSECAGGLFTSLFVYSASVLTTTQIVAFPRRLAQRKQTGEFKEWNCRMRKGVLGFSEKAKCKSGAKMETEPCV